MQFIYPLSRGRAASRPVIFIPRQPPSFLPFPPTPASNESIPLQQTSSQVTHTHQRQLHRHRLLGGGESLGCLAVSSIISFPFHVVEALAAGYPAQPRYIHPLLSLPPPVPPPPPSCLFVQVIFRQKSVVWSCLMVTRMPGRRHGWWEKLVSKIV
ncbi:hypothetical protein LZ31DRAFT_82505 [Colletotrichum somersetense]|nr:hypothetical protein LZ31DRAFT_82505 [Colletotrichum somersetense]